MAVYNYYLLCLLDRHRTSCITSAFSSVFKSLITATMATTAPMAATAAAAAAATTTASTETTTTAAKTWKDTKYSKPLVRYTSKANVKVRSGATSTSKVVKTMKKGVKLTVVGKTNTGYFKLKDGNYVLITSVTKGLLLLHIVYSPPL